MSDNRQHCLISPGVARQAATPADLPARLPIFAPTFSLGGIAQTSLRAYNFLRRTLRNGQPLQTDFLELAEVRERASMPSDIDEHMELMFVEALLSKPQLIVELGVRGGASTFAFGRAARCCGSTLISADLDDCSSIFPDAHWHFYRGDDIEFAERFPEFCKQRSVQPSIDLLFIDTSHYYDHTVQEIEAWFPMLSPRAKVMFHDTNLRLVGLRKDGCFALAWDNQRGVIRAIEDFLGIHIDERRECTAHASGWLVRHWPNCNGLTILDRLS